jgi:hypothetical protein
MKKAFAAGLIFFFFACSASAQNSEAAGGCTAGKSAAGAGIGVLIGTLLLPGIGTVLGGLLGGGGTCAYGFFKG